jgi:hypothetical protein
MTKIKQRLKKLEQRLSPSDDGACTLQELCYAMWRQDKRKFMEIANGSSLNLFVRQFQVNEEIAATDHQKRGRF